MPYRGDSFIVYVQNPEDTFPLIRVCRRRRDRTRGRVGIEEELGQVGNQNGFIDPNYDKTANEIGRLILDNSDIIQDFRA